MSDRTLAFDVGGANLKAATSDGYAASEEFPLWKHPDRLADELAKLAADAPECDQWAATMTGELADCYACKRDGVRAIIDALAQSADQHPLSIYLVDGTFATPDEAREKPYLAAASNWHALARFATRFLESEELGILVDVGSTTCDIIPLQGRRVVAQGKTDTQRLLHQELIYVGTERTPVCGIASSVPYREAECPIANELFATTLDVHVLTGDIQESATNRSTADGRPATRENALARLGRMVCADVDEFELDDAMEIAEFLSFELSEKITDAISRMAHRYSWDGDATVILSGHGEFLVRRTLPADTRVLTLSSLIDSKVARCAPAYAVAQLHVEKESGSQPNNDSDQE